MQNFHQKFFGFIIWSQLERTGIYLNRVDCLAICLNGVYLAIYLYDL